MTNESSKDIARGGSGPMFDRIAGRYDLVNRIISLGIDQGWRRRAVRAMALERGGRVLDLATGTADLAIQIANAHDVTIVGVDPSEGMLDIGRAKVERAGLSSRVTLEVGDAQELRFADDSFDAVSIAFGIRNVPDRPVALAEMARVTHPGGRVVILELSEPRGGVLGSLARFHVRVVVPRLGALLSGAREYRYLQESIAAFPPAQEFARTMETSGLRVVETAQLSFGVATLFIAEPARR